MREREREKRPGQKSVQKGAGRRPRAGDGRKNEMQNAMQRLKEEKTHGEVEFESEKKNAENV